MFFLAALAPVLLAGAGASDPQTLPAIQLTALPGSLSVPVQVTNAGDGSGRLFVVEQPGTIRVFKDGAFLSTAFLDVTALASFDGGEKGLLSMAFHPNYASNGFFYVYYTDKSSPTYNLTIARYHVSANPDVADPASGLIVLGIPHPGQTNHNGGLLRFGPDGYLYSSHGDGGSGGDPPNNAQNLGVLLGKMLRIDVDGTGAIPCGQSSPMPYAIPPTNPFVGVSGCDEIWAYGLRNPWRYSFDRSTGDLLIGDVGQNLYEEIDFQPASSTGGENYGWRKMEGFHCYDPPPCNDGSLTLPILELTHSDGWCAIIGGYRYRGTAIPALVGVYLYGDDCLGQIWGATESGGDWSTEEMLNPGLALTSFGEDEAGEVYLTELGGGKVYRIDGVTSPVPTLLNLNPSAVIAGGSGFTLTASGTGFVPGSIVQWNGGDRPTTYVSSTTLTATISAGDVATAGVESVTVFNPLPGGGASGSQPFHVNVTFLDVPTDYFAATQIQAVFNAGITVGCADLLYCPERSTSRAEMAVFLLKTKLGSAYVPPPAQGGVFGDVNPGDFAADWIEDIAGRGITAGCGNGDYCPNDPVTRAQMAVFLLKASQGSDYVPPPAQGGVFADVAPGDFAADWIEDLHTRGVAAGCDAVPNYCPTRAVTRAEMAVFLTLMFNLPLP